MESRTLSRVVNGKVMHRRHSPVENRFTYPVFYLLLNMDELNSLDSWLFGVNKSRPLSFSFKDYGNGNDPRLWVDELLSRKGIMDCDGPLWLQTFPRVFGYLFNPVSFWYCTRTDGSVGAIIAEVNNTFGGRHCYVLTADKKNGLFKNIHAEKKMYVSPFYPVEGSYHFFFNTNFDAPMVHIDYFNKDRLQLNTAIWGKSRSFSVSTLGVALLRQPLLTVGVMTKIHWQALKLWLKRVPLSVRPSSSVEEA